MNAHLLFGFLVTLRRPEVSTLGDQQGQAVFAARPKPFFLLSMRIPIQSVYGQEGGPGSRKTLTGS